MRLIRSVLSLWLSFFIIAVMIHLLVYPWAVATEGLGMLRDPPGENIFFSLLAQSTGLERLEPLGRQIFAGTGILVSFCVLIPPLRRFGGWLAFLFFLSIAGLLVSPLMPFGLPLSQSETATDDGALFYLAMASLTASFLLQAVHPGKQK
jgi:hypothetical protein